MSSWPLNGKKGGNRKHSKIDTLPPEMKATVEEMIMDGSATYSDIVAYLEQQGYSLSVSSVCRYAQGYVENLQTLQIAQANFRNMLDELERYPDLDTTEALVRVASQNLMTALTSKKDEDWSAVSVDKLMNQISGLTRAVAYKKRVELQNKSDIEAGTGDLKSALWSAMAKERPDLYKQVSAYDADQEWTERKELVQMGLLKPELALAWKFDLPAETEADLAEIRKNYMPELKDLEG